MISFLQTPRVLSTLLLCIGGMNNMNVGIVDAFQTPSTFKHYGARCQSLSLSSPTNAGEVTTSSSSASNISITKERMAILDGSSYKSLAAFLSIEQQKQSSESGNANANVNVNVNAKPVGVLKIIIGTRNQQRIVAMANANANADSNCNGKDDIWEDSIATIPTSVSDDDAMSTLLASLTGIHCSVQNPKRLEDDLVQYVGGSNDTFEVNENDTESTTTSTGTTTSTIGEDITKKIVVLGGSDYACFLADGIAALGAKVTQVSTNKLLQIKLPLQRSNKHSVDRTQPGISMGKDMDEVPFSSVIGKFDALVDTLTDEGQSTASSSMSSNRNRNGDVMCRLGYDYATTESSMPCNSAVITELNKQNECHRYISTVSQSQLTIKDDGILFGRGKADKYGKEVVKKAMSMSSSSKQKQRQFQFNGIASPKDFASLTLQPLLDAGVIYKQSKDSIRKGGQSGNEEVLLNGWNLNDFWELVSWPRDAEGGNVRFGLPMVEDLDSSSYYNYYDTDDDDEGEENDLQQQEQQEQQEPPLPEEEDGVAMATPISPSPGKPRKSPPKDEYEGKTNPHVLSLKSLSELNDQIIKPKKPCVLFLSAQYCRTCKYLTPQYTKLARNMSDDEGIVFAKVNTVGKVGKEVSRALNVDAVPAFCFFRDGNRYGKTLSISKMPSKKLDAAIELLMSGEEWDAKMIRNLKN